MRIYHASVAFLLLAVIGAAGMAFAQVPKGLNDLGVIAFGAKEYDLALEHFGKALELEPNNPALKKNICAVHQAVANGLAEEGKIAEALARRKK